MGALNQAAVLVIAFNRPLLFKNVIDKLLHLKIPKIYIHIDGPRPENIDDQQAQNQINLIVSNLVYDPSVSSIYLKRNILNRGCKYGVYEAITWAFSKEDSLIILEDDVVPSGIFFDYCNRMLTRYRNNESISMISGVNFGKVQKTSYKTNIFSTWGWATWRDRWSDFDLELRSFNEDAFDWPQIRSLQNRGYVEYWRTIIKLCRAGKLDTWDYQWVAHNWQKNRCSINPAVSLVENVGYGEHATHTKNRNDVLNFYDEKKLCGVDALIEVGEISSKQDAQILATILPLTRYDKALLKLRKLWKKLH